MHMHGCFILLNQRAKTDEVSHNDNIFSTDNEIELFLSWYPDGQCMLRPCTA